MLRAISSWNPILYDNFKIETISPLFILALIRKLGDCDLILQQNKVENLKIAVKK